MSESVLTVVIVVYGVLSVLVMRAVWGDIARWKTSRYSKVVWMFLGMTPIGFLLWAFISRSESRRRSGIGSGG